ncbi:Zinc finger, PMZ-type [Sesbania bispinosa]|nr:Zinc finger, PMZ-type [Sesbania bispinosa]
MMEQTETNNIVVVDPKNSKSPNKDNLDSHQIPEGYKRISELTDEDIRGPEFDTEEDAYDFYYEYAKFIGFSVRKGDVYRNCNGSITMRQLVCNREGERSEKHLNRTDRIREAKALTRTKCNVRLRISLDYRSRKWRVGIFEPTHNHELTLASMIHLLLAYRGLSVADKAQVDGLHHYGVRTCHIMDLIMGQKTLIYGNFSRRKFEDEWSKVVDKHGLRENRYEVQASNVYTRNKFFDVRKQIEKVVAINVIERTNVGNVVTMKMNKFGTPDSTYIVMLDKSNGNLVCDCRKFESCGIPCSHIFSAMKHEQVESIPASLISKRWTKLAKVEHISFVYAEEGDTSKKDLLRSGVVGAACNRLNKASRRNPHNFLKNIESIHKLAKQMERQEGIDLNITDISRVVRDRTVVKTKGAHRKNKKRQKKGNVLIVNVQATQLGHALNMLLVINWIQFLKKNHLLRLMNSRDESRSRDDHFSNHLNDVTVSAGQNCASDKGQSKKKRKNSERLKLTQESVNERRSNDVNKAQ